MATKKQKQRTHFTNMCWKVLVRLLNGEYLTVHETALHGPNHIGALPVRIKELIDKYGITEIKREWACVNGALQRYKWYYISEHDRIAVAERVLKITKSQPTQP